MTKDPEKFCGPDSVSEEVEDIINGAAVLGQKNLKVLMLFFKEMFEIAKPFTDPESKKIIVPGGKIPIDSIDVRIIEIINKIDGAFVETIRMAEWITVFSEGYKRCKRKLEQIG